MTQITDYQLSRGSLFSMPPLSQELDSPVPIARTTGVSIVPTLFPAGLFHHALQLQESMNRLYIQVSSDPEWLGLVLGELRQHDEFIAKLWSIWEQVRDEGQVQTIECGVWRSDYMLQAPLLNEPAGDLDRSPPPTSGPDVDNMILQGSPGRDFSDAKLKQVEFNTYSCAGGAHANVVADMHSYLADRGLHPSPPVFDRDALPRNDTINGIVRGLEKAHRAYGSPTQPGRPLAVLMTVQPESVNACDERPLEHGLWRCDPPIPLFQVKFSKEVLGHCRLGPDRELLYQPPWFDVPVEISVVYQRAAYDAEEHDEQGVQARLLLERSKAIKCPSVLGHLAGLKKVQQELSAPGVLERFLDDPDAIRQIRDTFVYLSPMDDSPEGRRGKALATEAMRDKGTGRYILKPSLEGGGHNIYGDQIPKFLRKTPERKWGNYILMERITPPRLRNTLVSYQDVYGGGVISELGVFGTCLWKKGEGPGRDVVILDNAEAGWSFKTKPDDIDEMSVVKGFGCFDCPRLVG